MLRVYTLKSTDIYRNLCIEERLMENARLEDAVLLFYVNTPCVVIGKNQNPWKECNVGALKRKNLPLARRISGGGTVYHDLGNLNYSFIVPRLKYRTEDIFSVLIRALASQGVEACVNEHHSLYSGGAKISGNAFCYRKNKALHHGTLLWKSDLQMLQECLKPSIADVETLAVSSRPAPVVNLTGIKPELTLVALKRAVSKEAGNVFGALSDEPLPVAEEPLAALMRERQSWKWVYGKSPRFTHASGKGAMVVTVNKGMVEAVSGPRVANQPTAGERFDLWIESCFRSEDKATSGGN